MVIIFRWGGFGLEPTYNIDYEQSLFFSQSDKHLAIKKNGAKSSYMYAVTYIFRYTLGEQGKKRGCLLSISK